jgi:hypothetical protein
MNIVILQYQMLQPGGYVSCLRDHYSGLSEKHNVKVYLATAPSRRPKNKDIDFNKVSAEKAFTNLPVLPLRPELIEEVYKDADLILFEKACPSECKTYRAMYGDSWKLPYQMSGNIPVGVIFHDPWVTKYYKWFADVTKYVDVVFPIHDAARIVVNAAYDVKKVEMVPFPIDFSHIPDWHHAETNDRVYACSVWKSWANMHHLVWAAPYLNDARLELASTGVNYREMRSEKGTPSIRFSPTNQHVPAWDIAEESGNMRYHGTISERKKHRMLRNAAHGISLANSINWRANTVRWAIELLSTGAAVLTPPTNTGNSCAHSISLIPKSANLRFTTHDSSDPVGLASDIDRFILQPPLDDIRIRNDLQAIFDHREVCEKILLAF